MEKKSIMVLLTSVLVLLSSYQYSTLSMELIQAIQDKKAAVVVASTGGHSGKCMQLKVTNQSAVPLYLEIAAGTIFIPDDDGEQTILVPKKNIIVLQKGETKLVAVNGYCTELTDRCPQTTSSFTIAKSTNKSLIDLVQFFAPLTCLDDALIQQAVWCLTNGESVSNVSGTDPATSKSVREFLFKQTGQAETWYSTKRVPEIAPDRSVVNTACEVSGKIEIKTVKPMELIGVVKNAAGEIVWKYPYRTTLPVGDVVFDFSLKVRGWKKGDYYIIYTSEGAELVNQTFSI